MNIRLFPSIPKSLLIHSIWYYDVLGKDNFNSPIYADPVIMNYVRFDHSVSYTRDSTQNMANLSGVIFIDARHTTNIPNKFKERAKINFNGKDYTIVNVIPFYHASTNDIRHYEIEVV